MSTESSSKPWPAEVTLERDGIRLEPLTLAHEDGLRKAAADGELWNIRVTSVPEPQETRAYIETALKQRAEGSRLAFAVIDFASAHEREHVVQTDAHATCIRDARLCRRWLARESYELCIATCD